MANAENTVQKGGFQLTEKRKVSPATDPSGRASRFICAPDPGGRQQNPQSAPERLGKLFSDKDLIDGVNPKYNTA